MHYIFENFIGHRDLYKTSLYIGGITSTLTQFFLENTPEQIFGISIVIWFLVFFINIVDIYTGIKADSRRKKSLGKKFRFESYKGWRAIEKVFIFTIVIAFVYYFEKEIIRLDLPEFLSGLLVYTKFILFFYVTLIEVQSIGENQFVRYGNKSKLFTMLDKIVSIVDDGILSKISGLFNSEGDSEKNEYELPNQYKDVEEEIENYEKH